MPSAEPPPLDWRAAALAVGGGDEPDEAFLCELLACFVREGLPHVRGALAAADAHRRALACSRATATAAAAGTMRATTATAAPLPTPPPPPPPPPDAAARRALAARLFAECHALKGSAANLCLLRLSAAARDVEAVCRPLTETANAGCDGGGTGETGSAAAASAASAASAAAAAAAAFDTLCAPPASALRALAAEFRAAARFVQREVAGPRGRAAREPALAAAFSAEGRLDIARAAAADEDFEREVAAPFRALLAGAPEPGDEGETRGGSGDGAEPSDGAAVHSPPARAAIAPAAAAATLLLRASDAPAATAPTLLRAAEAPAAAVGASAPPGAVCCFT